MLCTGNVNIPVQSTLENISLSGKRFLPDWIRISCLMRSSGASAGRRAHPGW